MDYRPICCIIGAILINLTLGTFYSIGNLLPYVASYMREHGNPGLTTEHGTWITATFLLGQGVFIIVGTYIEQNFNSRVACIFGCLLHCLSTFMTIWAINVSFTAVVLVYGLGSGLGCGSAYMASIIAAQKWFPGRKGFFTGIIVAGFGLGGLIFTNLQTIYVNPKNISTDKYTGYFSSEVNERVPGMFLYMGVIFAIIQTVGCLLAFPAPSNDNAQNSSALSSKSHRENPGKNILGPTTTIYTEDVLPKMSNIFSTFNYRIFYIIGLMMMLVAPGMVFVNSLGKRYGQLYIDDDRYLATVVAVAAVANALGRLTWGFLADKLSFSHCFILKVILFVTLVTLFPLYSVLSSKTGYLIWMLGLFFGFSGTFVLFPVFVEQVFGSKYHGIIYGILYILLALSSVFTSFILQFTMGDALDKQGKDLDEKFVARHWPCLVIAICYLISLAIFLLALPVKKIETAIRRRKENHTNRAHTSLANRPDLYTHERGLVTHELDVVDQLQRENSLGSIVKFAEAPVDNKFKFLGRPL